MDNTTANIIAAVASVFTALSLVISALALLAKAVQTGRKVDEVHTIVNQQRTDTMRYQIALVEVLKAHGIDVPIDQSLPIAEDQP